MIPVTLKLTGFLSYREPTVLDFSGFDLACISGMNGAGKSSLLDAITWALFGQARKSDDALIHTGADAAEVIFTFDYEGARYRVQRVMPRGKTKLLEFQIEDGNTWRALTEKSLRETQARIEAILRMDYETFVNASFFLQGKADQFTQQRPGDRKRILSSILGLEAWDVYKERAAERRKALERDLAILDSRLSEIDDELAEEADRKARLSDLETRLEQVSAARKNQEAVLESIRAVAASLREQRKLVETLSAQAQRAENALNALETRLAARRAERDAQTALLNRAADIEADYQRWQHAHADLERWENLAAQFRAHEKRRQPFAEAIRAAQSRLEQEREHLRKQQAEIEKQTALIADIERECAVIQQNLDAAAQKIAAREQDKQHLAAMREESAALKADNAALKTQMDALKARIENLEQVSGAECPLCGQPLSEAHRETTLAQLNEEGRQMGDRWRANKTRIEDLARQIQTLEKQIADQAHIENERLTHERNLSQRQERLENIRRAQAHWQQTDAPRLQEVEEALQTQTFAAQERQHLAAIDAELKALGYDPAAHESVRQRELDSRPAQDAFANLEKARAALAPLEREIADLQAQHASLQAEAETQRQQYAQAAARLTAAEAAAPNQNDAEQALLNLQEQENILLREIGAARQAVEVLNSLRKRRQTIEAEREDLRLRINRLKTLERAFGKDGVPALLIEQALPEIESKANDLLDRLSNGTMSVRFATQAEYKSGKRDDLKETLDILISDSAGTRDYEMFSGGEAFRVNFAIRLALSEVLAQRTGARLQTLVIDEGFGTQDPQGRQRLIEAINLVRPDFAKILIITHLDELKEAFPNRIEVEKTERGSTVRVV